MSNKAPHCRRDSGSGGALRLKVSTSSGLVSSIDPPPLPHWSHWCCWNIGQVCVYPSGFNECLRLPPGPMGRQRLHRRRSQTRKGQKRSSGDAHGGRRSTTVLPHRAQVRALPEVVLPHQGDALDPTASPRSAKKQASWFQEMVNEIRILTV